MPSKCARILSYRWAILAMVPVAIALPIISSSGYLPNNHVLETTKSDHIRLPFVTPRALDVVLVALPIMCLVWLFIDRKLIAKKYYTPDPDELTNWYRLAADYKACIVLGICFGVCGWIITSYFGVAGAAIGSVICGIIIGAYYMTHNTVITYESLSIIIAAVLVIQALSTVNEGFIAATVYSTVALVAANLGWLLGAGGVVFVESAVVPAGHGLIDKLTHCEVEQH